MDLALKNRNTACWEVVADFDAVGQHTVQKYREIVDRIPVVQNENRPFTFGDDSSRSSDPRVAWLPVTGDAIPSHDRVAACDEEVNRCRTEKVRTNPSTSVGTKEQIANAEISEGLLCLADLGLHAMTVGPFAEWRAMRHRVIADPMSGLAHSARCLLPSLLEQSLADDKEDRS